MLSVTKLWVRSFNLDHLDLFWEIAALRGPRSEEQPHEIFDYVFEVLHSEAAMGPYNVISHPLRDVYHFRDTSVSMLHAWRQHFYKLRVTHKPTGQVEEFGPAMNVEASPDLIAAEIIRQEDMLLREFIGRKTWLFPARTFGPRCSCYDVTMGRQTRTGHLPCFGTGWLGGYLSPVEMYVQFDPSPKQTKTNQMGESHPSNSIARTFPFPPINPRDVLIESENRRWRVVSVQTTQRLRAIVHQEVMLEEVAKGDIEFSIPLNINAQALVPASERNFRNPHDVDVESEPLSTVKYGI